MFKSSQCNVDSPSCLLQAPAAKTTLEVTTFPCGVSTPTTYPQRQHEHFACLALAHSFAPVYNFSLAPTLPPSTNTLVTGHPSKTWAPPKTAPEGWWRQHEEIISSRVWLSSTGNSRYHEFFTFLVVWEPVSEQISAGKKSRNRYRKNLVLKKVWVSVSKIFGTGNKYRYQYRHTLIFRLIDFSATHPWHMPLWDQWDQLSHPWRCRSLPKGPICWGGATADIANIEVLRLRYWDVEILRYRDWDWDIEVGQQLISKIF